MKPIEAALTWVRNRIALRKQRAELERTRMLESQMELRIRKLPDRLFMINSILPGVRENARDILWIGCRGYTREYHSLLEEGGARCWTIDIDPDAAQFGHPTRHIIGDIIGLEDFFSPDTFDAILCNGVFGWGVNSVADQSRVLGMMAHLLRPGGLLVLGWNTNKMPDPVELLSPSFEPADLFGLGKRVTFAGHTHVYDFCVATKKANRGCAPIIAGPTGARNADDR